MMGRFCSFFWTLPIDFLKGLPPYNKGLWINLIEQLMAHKLWGWPHWTRLTCRHFQHYDFENRIYSTQNSTFSFFMTVYFSDNLFDFLNNLEFFIFHFLLLFFSNCYQGNLSQIREPRTVGLKANLKVSDGQMGSFQVRENDFTRVF